MTSYTHQQVSVIDNAEARATLTDIGLPDTDVVSFRAAEEITIWDRDPDYAVVGMWNIDEIPVIVHRTRGTVHTSPPWSDAIDPLNASVRAFAESLAAVDQGRPLSEKRYGTDVNAGNQIHALLHAIDAETLADSNSFWQAVIDDIKVGNYD
ncbi:SUKH-4 family immunity protein [Amycolatopsis sp. 195334CR]|uniref:SUKH-4 family immunity protein n=1 Tax=Amycolatopsis sp. 195334CR TaxID=2814588 RepID=UPI001A8C22E3|nr:SUKH-4 family immunity protein [Amycolatopsis sp. 195334CR]MBN6039103.1 SUKH-4 family immunity protein [Amycolatopsis sp. 195334CR]